MNKEEQNIADVEFIFQEVQRFALMPPPDVIRHIQENRNDMFAMLNMPTGGSLFCGRAAYDRFDELADRTIKPNSSEAKTFDLRDYVSALRVAFVEQFVEEGKVVNRSSVTILVDRAKQITSEQLVR
jgi:hypothetical protein